MKKLIFVFGFILLATAARAEDCSNSPLEWIGCASMSSAYISLSNLGAFQNKAAYMAQLKDDAADYVAAGSGAIDGAVLREAIEGVRAHVASAQGLSDREIALLILSSN